VVPLSMKLINWTCQLVTAIAALAAKLMQPLLLRMRVLCGSISAGLKAKRNWRPLSRRWESSGISVPFVALTSWPSASHSHMSLCEWQRLMKTLMPGLLCTSGVHMTFRGYRTIRTFRSIKNGSPVDNQMPPNPTFERDRPEAACPSILRVCRAWHVTMSVKVRQPGLS